MSRPFLTVLVDTYNHERFIEQAIQSVLEQDFSASDREILVVDDGSTDRTPEILRRFEPQVRVLRKANGGQATAFNAGIPACRGEIIAFLDGDDWWAHSKLSKVSSIFAENRELGIVGHGITEVFPNGSQRTECLPHPARFQLNSREGALLFRARKQFLGTSRMTVRARLLETLLPVSEDLRIEADEFLFTVAALHSPVMILTEALTFYRLHGGNLYQMAGSTKDGLLRKQRVLVALAISIGERFRTEGVPQEIAEAVIEIIQAEADQLRLTLKGGFPWETVRTERTIYRVMHENPPLGHRIFRFLTMIPAALLPSSWFYLIRRRLAANDQYNRLRGILAPVPKPVHVHRSEKTHV
ncbi:MAG TPA: glycosyltransferase [Candidatus Acidoferrum sp.]|nr:glycosyltransferase [Candidatus Acidoferrum sp.]